MKQGEGAFGKGYKKRWFSQTGTCLYYYKQRSDSENAGFINLAEGMGCARGCCWLCGVKYVALTERTAISCHATEGAKGKFQVRLSIRVQRRRGGEEV